MSSPSFILKHPAGLGPAALREAVARAIPTPCPGRVLLLPPDITRLNSGAGGLTALFYEMLTAQGAQVGIMPALGTHAPMTIEECIEFFGAEIPPEVYVVHNWRTGVRRIGTVPADFVAGVSEGLMNDVIDVELSTVILDGNWDWIVSLGQVVPHEVVGLANYTKNLVVGCGGSAFINASHMLGAFFGLERIMGRADTPVRAVFDYAQEHFLSNLPLTYVLTVTQTQGERTDIVGLSVGRDRSGFEAMAALAQQVNITWVDRPINTCVVYLDPREFRSTWLGNKAVYRTRMAMAPGGRLIVLAPGVAQFGEDARNDADIRAYGYLGRAQVLEWVKTEKVLQDNLSAAAHLIHGSSDGKFTVTYATKHLAEDEVRGVGYDWMNCDAAMAKYDPIALSPGWNTVDGEEIYFIPNPALGLWAPEGAF